MRSLDYNPAPVCARRTIAGRRRVVALAILFLTAGCSILRLPSLRPSGGHQVGYASWYGAAHHGRRTSSGEIFDQNALTAAHPTLPFGTRVRVTNLENGKSVVVRVNDRGPYFSGRIIDVSAAAARALSFGPSGVTKVRIEPLR